MTIADFRTLQVCSEHFVCLSSIFDHQIGQLRAAHFRQAERNLTHLKHVFTAERAHEAENWLHISRSVQAMQSTLEQTAALKLETCNLEDRMTDLEGQLALWKAADPKDKEAWNTLAHVAGQYLDDPQTELEDKAIKRFSLYQQLKDLVVYAEEVDHLCSALKHYSKRDSYLEEKELLEKKILSAEVRLNSVKRGFFLSLILCGLIVTLPLCLPFAISLWNRIREIEKQLSRFTEERKRVLRRLDLAAEGVIAAEDITAILGERSLSDIRNVLEEVKSLHREFGSSNVRATALIRAITLDAEHRSALEAVFGQPPDEFRKRLSWIIRNIEKKKRQISEIVQTASDILRTREDLKKILRGYSEEILIDTIERMQERMNHIADSKWKQDLLERLMPLCTQGPHLVERVRSLLSQVSYGRSVAESDWLRLGLEVKSTSTTLNALLLEAELNERQAFDEHDHLAKTHASVG